MTDNEIIKVLECCMQTENISCCAKCSLCDKDYCYSEVSKYALDLINRQKAEIERLNKDCEDVIYKLECLLCNATGNKFSKHTYPIGDMVSYVNDYIQDCCDEAVEEAKEAVKSKTIKEFAERLKRNYCFTDRWGKIIPISIVDDIVKEMTENDNIYSNPELLEVSENEQ